MEDFTNGYETDISRTYKPNGSRLYSDLDIRIFLLGYQK